MGGIGWRIVAAPAHWLERAKGRRQLALFLLYGLALAAIGVLSYRQSRLAGLPDIGDPFDPTPLLAATVDDDDNAFVLYRQAAARWTENRGVELRVFGGSWSWPSGDAEAIAYLDANAEALDLWRRGSERPDALERPVGTLDIQSNLSVVQSHRNFVRLSRVYAAKAEADGDMEGAWRWYRAILRGSRLIGRKGAVIARLVGTAELSMLPAPVKAWSADPRTTPDAIRRALADVREANALTPTASESLRVEYLTARKTLEDPEAMWDQLLEDPWGMKVLDGTNPANHLKGVQRVGWFVQAEPERSRRLLRLAFANWLAHCDDPPGDRPALVGPPTGVTPTGPSAVIQSGNGTNPPEFFDIPSPAGPAPRDLARRVADGWLSSTLVMPFPSLQKSFDRDLAMRVGLEIALAEALYRREFGRDPDSPNDLVGTVMERLPEGYVPPEDTRP